MAATATSFACCLCPHTCPTKQPLLEHLLAQHKFVIAEVNTISDLPRYLRYWSGKLSETNIRDYAAVIQTNSEPNAKGNSEEYFLLSDVLPEEKRLRDDIRRDTLSVLLEVQAREREQRDFRRKCLFCKVVIEGNRADLFKHMFDEHSFNIGLPDNVVHVDELLNILEEKLNLVQCLYCERTFKDHKALTAHRKKKNHTKISDSNHEYDRFYIVNAGAERVLKPDQKPVQEQDERDSGDDSMEEFDEPEPQETSCLFCTTVTPTVADCLEHMHKAHNFDFTAKRHEIKLDVYSEIQFVNFVREKVRAHTCAWCAAVFPGNAQLVGHLQTDGHFGIDPANTAWRDEKYLIPVNSNDPLLHAAAEADADEDGDDADPPVTVYAADLPEDGPQGAGGAAAATTTGAAAQS